MAFRKSDVDRFAVGDSSDRISDHPQQDPGEKSRQGMWRLQRMLWLQQL